MQENEAKLDMFSENNLIIMVQGVHYFEPFSLIHSVQRARLFARILRFFVWRRGQLVLEMLNYVIAF